MKLGQFFSGFCVKCQGVKQEECKNCGRKFSVTCLSSWSMPKICFFFRKGTVKREGRKEILSLTVQEVKLRTALGILCMSLCSHGCNKAFQAWMHSRLSSSPCSLLLSAPPAQQMSFPLLSAMWWRVHGHHHPTYFMESNKKSLHAITFPKLLEAAVRNFLFHCS